MKKVKKVLNVEYELSSEDFKTQKQDTVTTQLQNKYSQYLVKVTTFCVQDKAVVISCTEENRSVMGAAQKMLASRALDSQSFLNMDEEMLKTYEITIVATSDIPDYLTAIDVAQAKADELFDMDDSKIPLVTVIDYKFGNPPAVLSASLFGNTDSETGIVSPLVGNTDSGIIKVGGNPLVGKDWLSVNINSFYWNGVKKYSGILTSYKADDTRYSNFGDFHSNLKIEIDFELLSIVSQAHDYTYNGTYDYYISPDGDNTNDGSYNSPFLTAEPIPDNSIIMVKNGTYDVNVSVGDGYGSNNRIFLGGNTCTYIGESKEAIIETISIGTRDTPIINLGTDITIKNLTINRAPLGSTNYSNALTRSGTNIIWEYCIFNISSYYSYNYAGGLVIYNNCLFNHSANLVQPNYNGVPHELNDCLFNSDTPLSNNTLINNSRIDTINTNNIFGASFIVNTTSLVITTLPVLNYTFEQNVKYNLVVERLGSSIEVKVNDEVLYTQDNYSGNFDRNGVGVLTIGRSGYVVPDGNSSKVVYDLYPFNGIIYKVDIQKQ